MLVSVSSFDESVARERGRLLAAQAIANNPEQKKVVEAVYGIQYCRNRYPEAYYSTLKTGIGRLLDNMKIFLTR
jgi:signal recognition particle subunit SEC65